MTKAFELQWKIPVPKPLLDGATFTRWTEEKDSGTDLEPNCLMKVDDCGFFISWKSEDREGDVLDVSQVNDIRPGERPKDNKLDSILRAKYGDKYVDQAFIICSGLDMVNISACHVVCPDVATAKVWKEELRKISTNALINNICPMLALEKHWRKLKLTVTTDGKVGVKSIAKTFASGKTEKLVYQVLSDCGLPNEKGMSIEPAEFTFEVFYKIYQAICPRTDIEELYKTLTKTETLDHKKFIEFLNDKQRDGRLNQILYPEYDKKRVMEIINKYEPNEETRKAEAISREGLIRYMMSDENAPVLLDRLDIYQDMEQPMCKYYINSSHNTYLSGKQFGGKSVVEMYRQTLLAGCRCVELDCWNGDEKVNFEPIITHGKAMCTDIMFVDCIYAIRDCAFVTSEYPVILSIENHCDRQQQLKMAKMMDEIFGDLLNKTFLPNYPMKKGVEMPPPSALKRKILLKNKRLKADVEKTELELYLKGEFQAEDEEGESTATEKKPEDAPPGEAPAQPAHTGGTTLLHPLFSSFINYITSVKFEGFDAAAEKNLTYAMSSFAETTALGYLKSQAIEFVNYNKRQISRIYPKGARVDSSNYMPQVFWNSGCQLVALNFQTPDLPMQLNQGKFEYNGGCGYLLKPEFMCREDKQFDPFAETPVDGVIAASCEVRVLSGQFLSDKKVGTYVEVDMYGLPADTIRKEFRTKVVPANGLNPVYNEDPFCFRKVVLPELAVLRFGVYDDNDKLLGQRILPFNDLQMGYRHIALRTEGNFPMALPMLFCQIDVKIYVPDGLGDFMDALSDPRAFLSAQEKRAEQLKALGIQENDIGTDVIEGKKKPAAAGKGGAGAKKEEKKEEELKLPPITAESIREEKGYVKATKKYKKEYDAMKKKQAKEVSDIMKKQCTGFEKQVKGKKDLTPEQAEADAKIIELVKEQTTAWTTLMNAHRGATWEMTKTQLAAQEDIMKKLMELAQAQQVKELEASFEKENKEMKAAQAKISVDTAKDVQADPTLKTKPEKDRRLKEKNQANTKKFIDERKNMGFKQNKAKTKLEKAHATQLEDLSKWIKTKIRVCDEEAAEIKVAGKREAIV